MQQEQTIAYLTYLKRLGVSHISIPTAASTPATATLTPPQPSSPSPKPAAAPAVPDRGEDLFEVPSEPTPDLTLAERVARLKSRQDELNTCSRCKLCPEQNRAAHQLVFGVGSPEAEIVFIGEGPGEEEDKQGIPFVGRAGELLTKIIGAMNLTRDDIYICNVVKHRPPGNRDPEADEIEACEPFLLEQLDIIKPKALITLGNCATKTLLRTRTGITRLRGTWQSYHGIPTMPTYHPAYLLRQYSRANREAVWSDVQAVMKKLDEIKHGA